MGVDGKETRAPALKPLVSGSWTVVTGELDKVALLLQLLLLERPDVLSDTVVRHTDFDDTVGQRVVSFKNLAYANSHQTKDAVRH